MNSSEIIAFCEECGKKNILDKSAVKEGMIVFTCSFCNYQNRYSLKDSGHNPIISFMETVKNFPEITGCFIFHRQKGITKNFMGKILRESDLLKLGKTLMKNYLACRSCHDDITEMSLVISDKVMVFKPIDRSSAVVIVSKVFPLPSPVQDQWKIYQNNSNKA